MLLTEVNEVNEAFLNGVGERRSKGFKLLVIVSDWWCLAAIAGQVALNQLIRWSQSEGYWIKCLKILLLPFKFTRIELCFSRFFRKEEKSLHLKGVDWIYGLSLLHETGIRSQVSLMTSALNDKCCCSVFIDSPY